MTIDIRPLLAVALLAYASVSLGSSHSCGLDLSLSLVGEGRKTVSLTLKNITPDRVRISRPEIPWANPEGMILLLVDRKSREQILPTTIIDDDLFEKARIDIEAGGQLRGDFPLYEMFPLKNRTASAYALFWRHEMRTNIGDCVFGGWIDLP